MSGEGRRERVGGKGPHVGEVSRGRPQLDQAGNHRFKAVMKRGALRSLKDDPSLRGGLLAACVVFCRSKF